MASVFPSSYCGIRPTSDPQLGALLRRVRDKVCEKVGSPWSTLQRAAGRHFDENRGLCSPGEVGRALEHFHVQLSAGECGLLYSSFPAPDGSARFDWRAFVAFIFPTSAGEMVAPRYGMGMGRASSAAGSGSFSGTRTASVAHAAMVDAQRREEEEQRQRWMHSHNDLPRAAEVEARTAAYFGGTLPSQTRAWTLQSTYPDQVQPQQGEESYGADPAQVYPYGSASPPPYVVARGARAEQVARAALERAFVASRLEHVQRNRRGLFPASMSQAQLQQQLQQQQATQRSGPLRQSFPAHRHAAPRASSSLRQLPPPPPPRIVPAPRPAELLQSVTHAPHRAPTAQQRREHTYMLPVPHRVSAAVLPPTRAQNASQDKAARTHLSRDDPHASDAYVQPGIQFGSAFKF